MSTPIDSSMDTDALCPAVRTLCDTLSRKFNEGPPGFGSVTFWAMHEEDVRGNPIPFSVQLTTCGFETEDTAIVVVEGMDIREIRCRLIAEANALLAQKAAAEPLQEDDLRSMVENFNFACRVIVPDALTTISVRRHADTLNLWVCIEMRPLAKSGRKPPVFRDFAIKPCRPRRPTTFEAMRRAITRHLKAARRGLDC